jgi:uncharacterized protein YcbK (DUF882 family)
MGHTAMIRPRSQRSSTSSVFFLRDHHSGQKTQIGVGVIDFLADVLDAVGETKASILSAYRTAETNGMLARTTFGVAAHS